jgi:ABC-2 type transport system permease protein
MTATAPTRPRPRPSGAAGRQLTASGPRAVAAIVATALRRVARDRLGLFFIVVLPFVIILLFGAGGGQDGSLPVGVVADEEAATSAVLAALEAEDALALRRYDDADALTRAVRRDELVGGLLLDSPGADDPGTGVRVRWFANPGAEAALAARVAVDGAVAQVDARLTAQRLAVDELGLSAEEARDAAAQVDGTPLLDVEEDPIAREAFSFGVDEAAQHNLVLFVFITSLTGGAALIESRRLGTAQRMLAAPVTAGTVLLGEAAARFAIALGQALIVLAGASLLFGARWGDPLAVGAIVAMFCLCGTGAAMLFGATLTNVDQATAIAAPLGIGLGMLGGALWPLEIVPPFMQSVGRAVPHSWAIDGLREVGTHGGSLGDVLPQLAVLAGFAAVLLAVATWRLGISLRRG